MPTATDKDGVVHNIRVGAGLAILVCDSSRSLETTTPHEEAPVTCFACIAEGPLEGREFMVCDRCGSWWREVDEKLVFIEGNPVLDTTYATFTVMEPGTLPTCKRCP